MRVYEYAKKNNITSKDVIEKLKELKMEVSNHMSTIEENGYDNWINTSDNETCN